MGYSFRLAARVLLYAPSHRQNSTYHGLCYTSRGALVGTRNNSMCPQWGINPTNHRTTNECSYYGTRPYIFENGRCYERLTADFCLDVNVYSFHTLLIQKINLGGDPNITRPKATNIHVQIEIGVNKQAANNVLLSLNNLLRHVRYVDQHCHPTVRCCVPKSERQCTKLRDKIMLLVNGLFIECRKETQVKKKKNKSLTKPRINVTEKS